MKTIFVTISRGATARNILQTDVYKKLKESGYRLVILTPAYRDEKFINEFRAENVFFEDLIEPEWTALDKFLVGWHKALVYNRSTELRDRYGIYNPKEGNFFKYIAKKIIFLPLSRFGFLKKFFRWLDGVLVRDKYYKKIFNKYSPDLIFSTSVMEDADVFVLKQAKERGIKTIGAAKSWDNISKMSFRAKTDKLLVWGEYSKEEAEQFQNYDKKDIIVCGVPQFDFYKDDEYFLSREDFCRELGIPADKKIILYTSGGKVAKQDGEVTKIIADLINDGLIEKSALLIRPHFAYQDDEKKFLFLENYPNVYLDKDYFRSPIFRDRWDYSKKQIKHFVNMMRYADIVIASASTTSLDAAAFNKPIINIAFDGHQKLPFAQSIARGYINEHNSRALETGGIWLVDSKEELFGALNGYFKNQNLLSAGRKRLKDYFCYRIDGRSGERMAEVTLGYL